MGGDLYYKADLIPERADIVPSVVDVSKMPIERTK
jgi:hypothetical protein